MDSVSLGDIAGMIAALAFAFHVFRLGSVIGKAGKILDETRISVRSTTENVQPTLIKLTDTVTLTNEQLGRVDGITTNVSAITTNASALTSLFAATLGSPVVKVAAFTYGVRDTGRGVGLRGLGHPADGVDAGGGAQGDPEQSCHGDQPLRRRPREPRLDRAEPFSAERTP